MNILTFDIEDWYNCDFISGDFDWDKFEVRIYEGVDRILRELDKRKLKGTFFCLGWLAENHPDVIKRIHDQGHQVGCHSYQHELSFRFSESEFIADTLKAKHLIEYVIGEEVNIFRAPGFSITKNNLSALRNLADMGFQYDCSLFPAVHDYGGMPDYGNGVPKLIDVGDGKTIKEFPISIHSAFGKNIVFSGGGFFRIFPYWLINKWGKEADYMMTYFHPRDFDPEQPVLKNLPALRRFKSYVGLKGAFRKFQHLLDDFEFYNLEQADNIIDWKTVEVIKLSELS